MKVKLITLLTVLVLVAWMPLAAQEAEPAPAPEPEQEAGDETGESEAEPEAEDDASGGDEGQSESEDEPPVDTAADEYADLDELPQTASHLALTAFLGIVGLASAYGLQRARRK